MTAQKKLIDRTKNGGNVSNSNVAEEVLVHHNLVDNQYQQACELLYTFTPNKYYAYLLNVEPSNLVFLKTYNADFDDTIISFTKNKNRPLKIEDQVNLTFLINK